MHTEFWWRNLTERDMEEQGVDVKISLDKQDGRTRTELARLRIRIVVFCVLNMVIKASGSIKCGEFLDQLRNCYPPKHSVPLVS